jgi:predicted lipoprotein
MKFRFIFTALVGAAACSGPSGPPGPTDGFDRAALLAQVGAGTLAEVRAFETKAEALTTATNAFCLALGTGDETPRREAARLAWRDAMSSWQAVEASRFGPVADKRDAVYSWPVVSTCAVDQEVMVRFSAPTGYDISTRLVNRRGLAALEHLLFFEGLGTTCLGAPAGWDALSDSDKRAARCGLAAAAAADLPLRAAEIEAAWEPYLASLSSAELQASVNVVSDALFFLDSEVKLKLAKPAGIMANTCGAEGQTCLADVESNVSGHSKENLLANLRGVRRVFLGGEGVGFDDFLRARGGETVAASMQAGLDDAIAKVEAIPGTLAEAVTASPTAVADAHTAMKGVTDLMKSQFLSILGLEIPDAVAGDND